MIIFSEWQSLGRGARAQVLHAAVGGVPVQQQGPQRGLRLPQQVHHETADSCIDFMI